MKRLYLINLILFVNFWIFTSLFAQPLVDTTYTWQGYSKSGITQLQIFNNPENIRRPKTVILKELGKNKGPSTVSDLPFLAEEISRMFNFNPTEAFWILHWGSFSFENARTTRKEIFLRASFRYTRTLQLGSPQWRVIDRESVEELTNRLF